VAWRRSPSGTARQLTRSGAPPDTTEVLASPACRQGRGRRDERLQLAAPTAASTPNCASPVDPHLLALRSEKPAVPQFAHYAAALDGGLEALKQRLSIFTIS
jgi:hypothetical protein